MTSISAKAFKNAYCICYSSMNPSAELASQQSRPFTNRKHIWRIMKQKYDKDDPGVLRILYHTAFLSQKSSNWSPQLPDRMLNSGKHGWFLEACRCHQIQNELNFVLKQYSLNTWPVFYVLFLVFEIFKSLHSGFICAQSKQFQSLSVLHLTEAA